MRRLADTDRIQQLMHMLGAEANQAARHQDLEDVRAMIDRDLIDPKVVRRYFDEIEPLLYRYPAIHPPSFRRAVEGILGQ